MNGYNTNNATALTLDINYINNMFKKPTFTTIGSDGYITVRGVSGYCTEATSDNGFLLSNATFVTYRGYNGNCFIIQIKKKNGGIWNNVPNNTPIAVSWSKCKLIISANL